MKIIYFFVYSSLLFSCNSHAVQSIEFNIEALDSEDRDNINLNRFVEENYITPGKYTMKISVNKKIAMETSVDFYPDGKNEERSIACITEDIVDTIGLIPSVRHKLIWQNNNRCLRTDDIPGFSAVGNVADSTLYINVPNIYLEYNASDWVPPEKWNNGINAAIVDYNINVAKFYNKQGADSDIISSNGVLGFNAGAWRTRADWQSTHSNQLKSAEISYNKFQFSRIYAYRALPSMKSKLTIGEGYLNSNMFESFRYTGMSLYSDISMTPPILRGYSPEITGIADTNATVTISQYGRIIHETQVAQGPFNIRNLSSAVQGTLDVTIREEDGTEKQYQVTTANLPYLTRPGQVQYKVAIGKPSNMDHTTQDDVFFSGEFSWGINNGLSLFGGTINSNYYNSVAMGIGQDLLALGTISVDMTYSDTSLENTGKMKGNSYSINYAKHLDSLNGQIQIAGYRFSDPDFMTMSDYVDTKESGVRTANNKQNYLLSYNQNINAIDTTVNISYSYQTYWDQSKSNYYNIMASRYIDLFSVDDISMNIGINHQEQSGRKSNSAYLSFSVPMGKTSSVSYTTNIDDSEINHRVNYYERLNNDENYQVSLGRNQSGITANGFYTSQNDTYRLSLSSSYQESKSMYLGANINGGVTISTHGADTHRMNTQGGARFLINTNDKEGIQFKSSNTIAKSNFTGTAVVGDLNNYANSKINVDINKLPEDVEVKNSVIDVSLSEGAVGYRELNIIKGIKIMTIITEKDGTHPPLGSQVKNNIGLEIGIVGEEGYTYIFGANPKDTITVSWSAENICKINLPEKLIKNNTLSLICI